MEEEEESKKQTLAGASAAGLDKYLERRNKRTKKPTKQTKAAENALNATTLRQAAANDAICGAPAQLEEVEHDTNKPALEGRSRVEDAPTGAPFWPIREEGEDDWEDDWGDEVNPEDEAAGVSPEIRQADKSLLITLGKEETKLLQPARRKFSPEERRAAALSHQLHLLCLLARGSMMDHAASTPLVQAVAVSFVPAEIDAKLSDLPKSGLKMSHLTAICEWFRNHTSLGESTSASPLPDPKDFTEGGVEWMSQRLQKVASSRAGSPEELIALFVAVLRSHGLLTRFVRALDPLPWWPTLKERYIPRQQRPPTTERPSRKRKADDSAAKADSAAKVDPTIEGEKSTGKKRSAIGKAEGDQKEETVEPASGSTNPSGQGNGRGRGRGRGKGRGSGRGRGRAKASGDEPYEPKFTEVDEEDAPSLKAEGKTTRSKRRKGKSADNAEKLIDETTEAKARSGVLTGEGKEDDNMQSDKGSAGGQQKRRRRGDIEFENEIAMAIQASTAGLAGPSSLETLQDPALDDRTEEQVARRLRLLKSMKDKESGSVWTKNANQNQVADTWAEVYCDGEDEGKGRWVHIQPLLSWMNRPELVETASLRFEPLNYVVAFSGGGAKDVTSRYVSNSQEREKRMYPEQKRWWKETTKPLRQAEVVATRAHLSAHHTEVIDLCSDDNPSAKHQAGHGAFSWGEGQGAGKKSRRAENLPVGAASKHPGNSVSAKKPKDEVAARASREDEELKSIAKKHQQIIPTTLDGFKHHKLYVLQRHISRYCALRPKAQVLGYYRGEPYYQRSDVSELHTAEKWITHGQEVLPSQLTEPAKTVAKRGSKAKQKQELQKDAGDFDEEEGNGRHPVAQDEEANTTKLYGKWQTKAWTPPVAFDGIVPKNERGNVHCPPLAPCLPLGTRQVSRPRVVGVCKRLDVDYAMAMTGFDIRGGRSIPRFEGVVVCEEFADLVEQEWEKEQRKLEERKAEKRMSEASQTWSNLLRAMFMRLGLQGAELETKTTKKSRKPSKASGAEDGAGTSTGKRKRGPKAPKSVEPVASKKEDDVDHARNTAEIEEI